MDPRSFTFEGGETAIVHAVVDGLRMYWIERDGPFRAVLVFRIGMADEPLPKRGICHLVEHLAIAPETRLYSYNGWSSPDDTGFWAEGTRDEALGYLTSVAAGLRELPVDRFETEKRILATEGQNSGNSMPTVLLRSRCGARGYGRPSFEEFGLYRLSPQEAQEWADRYFVAENAVLFMSGAPPEGFTLELRRGEAQPLPAPTSIDRLALPTSIEMGQGAVGAGMMVERGPVTGIALATLRATATQRLRYELGHSYTVWSDYQLIGASEAHLTVGADCMDAGAVDVLSTLAEVIDRLAEDGPDTAALALEVERFRRMLQDPLDLLLWAASASLIGVSLEELDEQNRGLAGIGPADVAAVIREGAARMIMLLPNGVAAPAGRFHPYPHFSPRAVEGRMVRPAGLRRWLGLRSAGIVVGDEGVSAVYANGNITTIAWDDVEAVLDWNDGTVGLIGCDGDHFPVPPQVFGASGVAKVREAVEQHLAPELRVPMP